MFVEKVRSLWGDARRRDEVESAPAEEPDGGRTEPVSSLFSCPECDVVYIALDKQQCSNCRSEVREVRSTLSNVP